MKKLTLFAALLMLIQVAFAGGILTNTNQSAQFIRMLSRNASTDIDAVYYNPAGLIKLSDGWHFAFYSQTIFQDKIVDSEFPLLNDGHYVGKVSVPVFPTAFGVYKKENWAFSLGFGPNGGGGSAEFDRGLPSFEIPITKLGAGLKKIAPLLSAYQVPGAINNGYNAELFFKGSSVFWGIQFGATYKVNDFFSVYGGIRYLPAKNSYNGEIKDIEIETSTGMIGANDYLSLISPILTGTINTLQTASAGLTAAINAGYLEANASVSDPQILQLLGVLGVPQATNQQAVGIMDATKTSLTTLKNADVSNKEVKTTQTGAGFTPMIGVNISPSDNLNIAIKYEMKTTLQLTNDTEVDDLGLFPDGGESNSDLPAILGIGIGYKPVDWLETQLSYTGYFNKGVNLGYNTRYLAGDEYVKREIDNNGYEIGLGLQFNLSEKFALSVGGLYGDMGIANSYQSDFSYSNPSFTYGGGIMWKITDRLILDAGISNTDYKDQVVTFTDPDVGNYKETLGKTTLNFAAGISYSIF